MKKNTWYKHHKWIGIVVSFFLLMFCISGLILNHPTLFSNCNISRSWLPKRYQYDKWNLGLLRGSIKWHNKVLVYGNSGIWKTDTTAKHFDDFNQGLPTGADARNIKGMVILPSGKLFAAGQYGLYVYANNQWQSVNLPIGSDEKLCDITSKGDSLLFTTRSFVYLSKPPYQQFQRISLQKASDSDGKVSLFRTVWLLHSGELFGLIGVLIVDMIAIVFILLIVTGIFYWIHPKGKTSAWLHRKAGSWHNEIGRISFVLALLLSITGWLLRPPALLAIASGRVPAIPFSTLDSDNSWNDQLRSIRYDQAEGDWLLYTSNGFYSLKTLQSTPYPVKMQPPVSVMGINVETQDENGYWLIGSFSGMYIWERKSGIIADYYTHGLAEQTGGIPISAHAVSGYTNDFGEFEHVIDYNTGCEAPKMPAKMKQLPMSLRNVALELHTGRLYTFLGSASIFYIFIIGLAVIWCLWSGWKIRYQKRKKDSNKVVQKTDVDSSND